MKLVALIMIVLYITHLIACLWYWVGGTDDINADCFEAANPDGEDSGGGEETIILVKGSAASGACKVEGWVSKQGWGPGVSYRTRWLRAFYWGITTLTTVGYGDITASTNGEMVFASMAELVGTMVFGTLVGTVGSIVTQHKMLDDRHEVRETCFIHCPGIHYLGDTHHRSSFCTVETRSRNNLGIHMDGCF